jgi:hypothetical protein
MTHFIVLCSLSSVYPEHLVVIGNGMCFRHLCRAESSYLPASTPAHLSCRQEEMSHGDAYVEAIVVLAIANEAISAYGVGNSCHLITVNQKSPRPGL